MSEIIMSKFKSFGTAAILLSASVLASATTQPDTFNNGRSWYGGPNSAEQATRVVDVNSVEAINAKCGDTITFRNGDKTFTWRFDVVSHRAVDFRKVAPAGFASKELVVYVSRNDTERN
jgi:hypothetical protein